MSTSLQPFRGGDVVCCDVMCDDVMRCHNWPMKVWLARATYWPITAVAEKIRWLICLRAGRPDSGMHLSVQSPFSGGFLCSSPV